MGRAVGVVAERGGSCLQGNISRGLLRSWVL